MTAMFGNKDDTTLLMQPCGTTYTLVKSEQEVSELGACGAVGCALGFVLEEVVCSKPNANGQFICLRY